ncbi:hypothetical protein C8J57DRAFT_1498855 [Mycena rebaudengoi]|nr:hypothetical protein C8J57DRAFT_1498855 [Mycena rebaudengoi]
MATRTYQDLQSPIRHLLYTNFVPSDAQCNDIRTLVSDAEETVAAMDSDIADLRAAVDKLLTQREKLCADISAHQALVTPARRLPRDIIQELFAACLPADRNPVMDASDAPIILTQICRSWRTIALSTPCLWARLHVVISDKAEKTSQLADRVKAWVGRSGVLPLSLSVVLSRTFVETPEGCENAAKIFATLAAYSRRWKRIEFLFALATEPLLASLTSLSAEDVPQLEKIVLSTWIKEPEPACRIPILDTPSLRIASINSFGHTPVLPAVWDNLTELHLNTGEANERRLGFTGQRSGHPCASTYLPARMAVDILRRCPNLEVASLDITCDYREATTSTQPRTDTSYGPWFALTKLRKLSIWFMQRPPNLFFQTIAFPALRSFRYLGGGEKMRLPFLSLLAEARHLQELTLCLQRFTLAPILAGLLHVPELTKLKLRAENSQLWNCYWPVAGEDHFPAPRKMHEELLAHLTPNILRTVCPRLQSLELDECTLFSDASLLSFLQARLGGRHAAEPLKHFRARFSRPQEMDVVDALEPLIGPDVSVELLYHPSYIPPPPASYSPWEGVVPGRIPFFYDDPGVGIRMPI